MKRLVAVLFAVLMVLASPVMAAEPVTTLPEVKPVESGRMDLAVAVNKDVMLYAKAEFTGDRIHAVAADVQGRQVIEIVLIGNRIYLRENTSTRWQATTVEIEDPEDVGLPVGDIPELEELVTIYNLGTVNVRGIPTTQYQAQVNPEVLDAPSDAPIEFNLNAFIGNADSFLHKFQATIAQTLPETGEMLLETPLDIYDFNQPIVIGAPAPELVDEVGTLAVMERSDLPGANVLPLWMRPLEEYSLKAKGLIH